jgi:hypothetical protein
MSSFCVEAARLRGAFISILPFGSLARLSKVSATVDAAVLRR